MGGYRLARERCRRAPRASAPAMRDRPRGSVQALGTARMQRGHVGYLSPQHLDPHWPKAGSQSPPVPAGIAHLRTDRAPSRFSRPSKPKSDGYSVDEQTPATAVRAPPVLLPRIPAMPELPTAPRAPPTAVQGVLQGAAYSGCEYSVGPTCEHYTIKVFLRKVLRNKWIDLNSRVFSPASGVPERAAIGAFGRSFRRISCRISSFVHLRSQHSRRPP